MWLTFQLDWPLPLERNLCHTSPLVFRRGVGGEVPKVSLVFTTVKLNEVNFTIQVVEEGASANKN